MILVFTIVVNLFAEVALETVTKPGLVNKRDLLGLLENIFDQRKIFSRGRSWPKTLRSWILFGLMLIILKNAMTLRA